MAIIKPFKAWRPTREFIQEVACVPYDVIDTGEARELAQGKPNSFLHVIRPEIDLSKETDIHAPEVYAKGKERLDFLFNSGFFVQESQDSLYIYRLIRNGIPQTGIFSCVSVADYDHEIILKHELTRPDKENDRTKHIITQRAHAEPVMMTFKDSAGIGALMENEIQNLPLFDFVADDGVKHTIWNIKNTTNYVLAFRNIGHLYIADGHHRCASAARAAHEYESHNPHHTGEEEYNFFPAVLFPMDQMNILSYHRIIYSVPENFLDLLSSDFELKKNVNPNPIKKGTISFYLDGCWYGLELPGSQKQDPASNLDVSRLQEFILEPILGITDQRKDKNINFVGGIRGTSELEKLVNSGIARLAISMYPTGIEELVEVSDAGLLMPPKSTWFEPKLRSGLLVHSF